MDSNKDNAWWTKGSLKDWAIIVGLVVYFVSSQWGASSKQDMTSMKLEQVQKDVSEINSTVKEMSRETKVNLRDIEMRQNKIELEIEILKKDVKSR